MALGEVALTGLGFSDEEASETALEVKRRDAERLQLQVLEGSVGAGQDLVFQQGQGPVPTPLTPPKREAKALTQETAEVAGKAGDGPSQGS
jgi:glutathione-regulated potassium-efflux system protein KefB